MSLPSVSLYILSSKLLMRDLCPRSSSPRSAALFWQCGPAILTRVTAAVMHVRHAPSPPVIDHERYQAKIVSLHVQGIKVHVKTRANSCRTRGRIKRRAGRGGGGGDYSKVKRTWGARFKSRFGHAIIRCVLKRRKERIKPRN